MGRIRVGLIHAASADPTELGAFGFPTKRKTMVFKRRRVGLRQCYLCRPYHCCQRKRNQHKPFLETLHNNLQIKLGGAKSSYSACDSVGFDENALPWLLGSAVPSF